MMTMETLQKEKLADKEMVTQVQKAMTLIKEAHAQDQRRWEEEKARLDRQIKEVSFEPNLCQVIFKCLFLLLLQRHPFSHEKDTAMPLVVFFKESIA